MLHHIAHVMCPAQMGSTGGTLCCIVGERARRACWAEYVRLQSFIVQPLAPGSRLQLDMTSWLLKWGHQTYRANFSTGDVMRTPYITSLCDWSRSQAG